MSKNKRTHNTQNFEQTRSAQRDPSAPSARCRVCVCKTCASFHKKLSFRLARRSASSSSSHTANSGGHNHKIIAQKIKTKMFTKKTTLPANTPGAVHPCATSSPSLCRWRSKNHKKRVRKRHSICPNPRARCFTLRALGVSSKRDTTPTTKPTPTLLGEGPCTTQHIHTRTHTHPKFDHTAAALGSRALFRSRRSYQCAVQSERKRETESERNRTMFLSHERSGSGPSAQRCEREGKRTAPR